MAPPKVCKNDKGNPKTNTRKASKKVSKPSKSRPLKRGQKRAKSTPSPRPKRARKATKAVQTTTRSKKSNCRGKRKNNGKRGRNAYIIFYLEVYERLRGRFPIQEIARKAGNCWRKLSDEQKEPYFKRACGQGQVCPRCPTCKQLLPRK